MRGHVAKKGNRYYVVVDVGVDERGKRRRKWVSGFAKNAEAERKLTETLAPLDQGTYVEPSNLSLERYLLDEWLPACAARIRATAVESYRDLIDRHVTPAIGAVPLASLTPLALTSTGRCSVRPRPRIGRALAADGALRPRDHPMSTPPES